MEIECKKFQEKKKEKKTVKYILNLTVSKTK